MARISDVIGIDNILNIFTEWECYAFAIMSEKKVIYKCAGNDNSIEKLEDILSNLSESNVYDLLAYQSELPKKINKDDADYCITFRTGNSKEKNLALIGSAEVKQKTDFQITLEKIMENQTLLIERIINKEEEEEEADDQPTQQEKFYSMLNGVFETTLPNLIPFILEKFTKKDDK